MSSEVVTADAKANVATQFVDDMKSSLFFKYNWNELLSAAPMSLSLLGSCLIVASAPLAATIALKAPATGWEYIKQDNLRAALVQCTDTGRDAFGNAQASMNAIGLESSSIKEHVKTIIQILAEPDLIRTDLKPAMEELKNSAEKCRKEAGDMEKNFDKWLGLVSELHQATVAQDGDVAEKQRIAAIQTQINDLKLKSSEEQRKSAQAALTMMEKNLETADKAFKTASDKFPTGWDIVGQQLVSNLGDALVSAVNTALPAVLSNLNPATKIGYAAGVLGNTLHGGDHGQPGDGQGHPGTSESRNKTVENYVLPDDYDDPAYSKVIQVISILQTLKSLVTGGKEGAVDWTTITGANDTKTENSLEYVLSMFESFIESFQPTSKPPSVKLSEILGTSKRITDEIMEVAKNHNQLNWSPPEAKDKKVQGWISDTKDVNAKALALYAVAKSIPGNSALPPSSQPDVPNPTDKKSAYADQVLTAATNRLNTTQKAFEAAQKSYLAANDKLLATQQALVSVKAEMDKLDVEAKDLKAIKVILVKCIEFLSQLKEQVNRLHSFFEGISILVTFAVDNKVTNFLNYLNTMQQTAEKNGPGGLTFGDFQRQRIYTFTLMIRAYFGLFKDISDMYIHVSMMHIMPGIEKLNIVGLACSTGTAKAEIDSKKSQLDKYTTDAMSGIKEYLVKTQAQITDSLSNRVQDIQSTCKELPAPSLEDSKAIEEGSSIVIKTATTALKETAVPAARSIQTTKLAFAIPE